MEPVAGSESTTNRGAARPHPARPDGAPDGVLSQSRPQLALDPIRLVRMVNQIVGRHRGEAHSPSARGGWGLALCAGTVI